MTLNLLFIILVDKIFLEQPFPEPEVEVLILMYEPLEVANCEKCGRILVEPKELIDFWETEEKYRGWHF